MTAQATRTHLDWAPAIPPAWDVVRLRWVARIFAGGTPDRSNLDFWTEGTIPWLNSGSVNDVVISAPSAYITQAAVARGATRWAPAGSVLIALAGQGKTKGMAARLEIDSTLNQSMAAVVPDRTVDYRYLQYWLASNYLNLRGLAGGDLRDGLNLQHIGSVQMPRPDIAKQRAIADFLDRETAQIDAFIAKNEQLIALLTERRAAVIAHAVTRGLDKSVDLRSTGSRWVRDIPNRWEYGNIRRFATMRTGHTPSRQRPEYWVDCDIPWFTLADVWRLRSGQRDMAETSEKISLLGLVNSSAELLPVGTVALSRTASVGFAGIMSVPMATSQDFWNWVPGPNLTSKYLWYQFQAMRSEFDRLMTGSTHRTIYKADAASLYIVVPPVDEQKSIVAYLESQIPKIDSAVGHAQRAIDLARERRAALISAAVTGKIDVGVDA